MDGVPQIKNVSLDEITSPSGTVFGPYALVQAMTDLCLYVYRDLKSLRWQRYDKYIC